MTTSLKYSATVPYPAQVPWLIAAEAGRSYLDDHMYTFLRSLSAVVAELGADDGDLDIDESVPLHVFTSSIVVPLEKYIPQKSWKGAREVRIKRLGGVS